MNNSWIATCGLAILVSCAPAAAASPSAAGLSPTAATQSTFTIPLHDGRIAARDMLTNLCSSLGLNTPHRLQQFDWTINVDTPFARHNLECLAKVTKNVLAADWENDKVTFSVNRAQFETHLHALGKDSERWLREIIDAADIQSSHQFGITCVCRADSRSKLCDLPAGCTHAVVLVHGLDNPGFIWRDIIPILQDAGYAVVRFDYPNDGPIEQSADLFADELRKLREHGVKSVDVIAHSMGGLVTRDLLTRSELYGSNGGGNTSLPAIDRFIMVGTPNHGSEMAHLHPVAELGEQLIRIAALNGTWDGFSADGNGEAEPELFPDSEFLKNLNSRPLPSHTKMTIVAGRWLGSQSSAVQTVSAGIDHALTSEHAPSQVRDFVSQHGLCFKLLTQHLLAKAADDLGDGVVTLDSAKLDGVTDFNVVTANHVGLLFGDPMDSSSSALAIILDRLSKSLPN
ncbi:MAG TPA: alpha/beta fold hydrolase [Phycisphaerales bacterium]|nr:alpha/beta fold hydrolase [Phycisphaerales bacterium]